MPKYARIDSAAASPQPVTGWYDTDALHYPTLPAQADLVVCSPAVWEAHFKDPSAWEVRDGALIEKE